MPACMRKMLAEIELKHRNRSRATSWPAYDFGAPERPSAGKSTATTVGVLASNGIS